MKLSSREAMLKQQTDQFNAATVERNSAEARVRILTDMQRDYEGYSKAVKTVMREANRGTLRSIHGPVSGLIRTDGEMALAIETALGNAAQNIVVGTQNDARLAIEMLQRQDAGRATFLPLDTIRGEGGFSSFDPSSTATRTFIDGNGVYMAYKGTLKDSGEGVAGRVIVNTVDKVLYILHVSYPRSMADNFAESVYNKVRSTMKKTN